jgi:hypothetical protein
MVFVNSDERAGWLFSRSQPTQGRFSTALLAQLPKAAHTHV